MNLYFFHGKESGPHGSKYHSLTTLGDVISPDFQGMNIEERLEKAIEITADQKDLVVVGSSMGGLLAALLYDRHPERFAALILLAPALYGELAQGIERMPPADQFRVLHGGHDEIVPVEAVQNFCDRFDLPLTIVDDKHRLKNSHSEMLEMVRTFIEL